MSVQKRKLSHWSIEFTSGDEHHFDPPLFAVFLHYADDLSEENLIYTFLFIKRHKSCSKKAPGQTGIAGLTWGFYQGSTWYIFGVNASQVRCCRFEKCRNSKGFWVQVSILP